MKKIALKLTCLSIFMTLNACSLLIKQPKFDAGFDCKGEVGQYPNHCCDNGGKGKVIKTAPENPECPPGGIGGSLVQGRYDRVAGLLKNMDDANGRIAMLEYGGANSRSGLNLLGTEQAAATSDPKIVGNTPLSGGETAGQLAGKISGTSSKNMGSGPGSMNIANPLGSSGFGSSSTTANDKKSNPDSATSDSSAKNAASSGFKNGAGGAGSDSAGPNGGSSDWVNPFFNNNTEENGLSFAGNVGVTLQKYGLGGSLGSGNDRGLASAANEDLDTYLSRVPAHLNLFQIVHKKYQKIDQDWTLKRIKAN